MPLKYMKMGVFKHLNNISYHNYILLINNGICDSTYDKQVYRSHEY